MNNSHIIGIGLRLKELREKEMQLTQLQLADDMGILQKTLSKIENGLQKIDPVMLLYWHRKGYSLNWIISGEGSKYSIN